MPIANLLRSRSLYVLRAAKKIRKLGIRTMARLNDLTLRSLQPRKHQYVVFDDSLPNFGVRVGATGTLSFFVMYSVHGRRRRDTLGRFPVLALAEARKLARDRLARIIVEGKNPHVTTAKTFGEAVDDFFKLYCETQNKPSTAQETQRLMRRDWLPLFSRRLLEDIHPREISLEIDRKRRDRPEAARHAFSVLRKFFNWAKQHRLVKHSPCDGLQFGFRSNPRTRVLSEIELVKVFTAADDLGYPYAPIVHLLMLTGQRRGEIANLRWSHINEAERTVTLPRQLTKNGREHTFPYGPLAAKVIAAIPQQGDMLFPARGCDDRPYSGWSKTKIVLDDRCRVHFTLHDLRRTWATYVAELGVHPWVIEAQLNHVSGVVSGIAAVYNRDKYLNETREAVEKFEIKLAALLEKSLNRKLRSTLAADTLPSAAKATSTHS